MAAAEDGTAMTDDAYYIPPEPGRNEVLAGLAHTARKAEYYCQHPDGPRWLRRKRRSKRRDFGGTR